MIGLDRTRKEVHLAASIDDEGREITPPRSIAYDTLVIAIGSVTNDFGTPGVAEYAVPLETPAQAERFNRRPRHVVHSARSFGGAIRQRSRGGDVSRPIMEIAPGSALYQRPRHPYTVALLEAVPEPDPARRRLRTPLRREIPSPFAPPWAASSGPDARTPSPIAPRRYLALWRSPLGMAKHAFVTTFFRLLPPQATVRQTGEARWRSSGRQCRSPR